MNEYIQTNCELFLSNYFCTDAFGDLTEPRTSRKRVYKILTHTNKLCKEIKKTSSDELDG